MRGETNWKRVDTVGHCPFVHLEKRTRAQRRLGLTAVLAVLETLIAVLPKGKRVAGLRGFALDLHEPAPTSAGRGSPQYSRRGIPPWPRCADRMYMEPPEQLLRHTPFYRRRETR